MATVSRNLQRYRVTPGRNGNSDQRQRRKGGVRIRAVYLEKILVFICPGNDITGGANP